MFHSSVADLRQRLWDGVDAAPQQSTEARAKHLRWINLALLDLAQKAPWLFFQATGKIATLPDLTPASSSDTVSVTTTDAWVLTKDIAGVVLGTDIPRDRSYDGAIIEVTDTDGVTTKRRIRTVWLGSGNKIRISLFEPWRNITDTGMAWKIYHEHYYIPADILQVRAARLRLAGQSAPLAVEFQHNAEAWDMADSYTRDLSQPTHVYRRDGFSLPAPTFTPVLAASATNWSGPDPAGSFLYCFTYCWGLRDLEFALPGPAAQTAAQGLTIRGSNKEPLWESPPSPISDSRAVTYGAAGIDITLPDVDYMQGFGDNTMERYHRSGWYKRIYRRRISASGGANPNIETPNAFFLWKEVDGSTTTVVDDGANTPDYHRRLIENNAYMGIALYPPPDQRYVVELRATRQGRLLTDDADAIPLQPAGIDALKLWVQAQFYESEGNWNARKEKLAEYASKIDDLKMEFGVVPTVDVFERGLTRATESGRYMRFNTD